MRLRRSKPFLCACLRRGLVESLQSKTPTFDTESKGEGYLGPISQGNKPKYIYVEDYSYSRFENTFNITFNALIPSFISEYFANLFLYTVLRHEISIFYSSYQHCLD